MAEIVTLYPVANASEAPIEVHAKTSSEKKIARINDAFRKKVSADEIMFFPDMMSQGTLFSMQILNKIRKAKFCEISPNNKTDLGHQLHHRGEITMRHARMSVIWTIFNLDETGTVLDDNSFNVYKKRIALLTSQELCR